MIDLVVAEGRRLEQILDDTYDLWHEGLSRPAYGRYYDAQRQTPWGRAHLDRFALVDGGALLASAKLYEFEATLDGRVVRAVGLGALFTSPSHRGRGHAATIVERLLTRAAGAGADLALLFSEIGPDYYRRLGFDVVPTVDLVLQVAEPRHRGAPAMGMRAGEARDLPAIVELGAVRAATYRLHLNRDRDLVAYAVTKKRLLSGLAPPGRCSTEFFVAEEGGTTVAYVLVTERNGDWVLEECGDRDPTGARIGAILQALIAREPGEQRPAVRGWLPPGVVPPQIAIVGRRPAAEVMMIRPLHGRMAPLRPLAEDDVLYCRSDYF